MTASAPTDAATPSVSRGRPPRRNTWCRNAAITLTATATGTQTRYGSVRVSPVAAEMATAPPPRTSAATWGLGASVRRTQPHAEYDRGEAHRQRRRPRADQRGQPDQHGQRDGRADREHPDLARHGGLLRQRGAATFLGRLGQLLGLRGSDRRPGQRLGVGLDDGGRRRLVRRSVARWRLRRDPASRGPSVVSRRHGGILPLFSAPTVGSFVVDGAGIRAVQSTNGRQPPANGGSTSTVAPAGPRGRAETPTRRRGRSPRPPPAPARDAAPPRRRPRPRRWIRRRHRRPRRWQRGRPPSSGRSPRGRSGEWWSRTIILAGWSTSCC